MSVWETSPLTALQDGKPYILSLTAGPAFPDQRSQGYTVAAVSKFATLEDMKYYDEGCPTHAQLKGVVKGISQGVMTVYFQSVTSDK